MEDLALATITAAGRSVSHAGAALRTACHCLAPADTTHRHTTKAHGPVGAFSRSARIATRRGPDHTLPAEADTMLFKHIVWHKEVRHMHASQ